MSGCDLDAEYADALRRTKFAALRPLIDSGVGGAGLALGPALARIRRSGVLFELDSDGARSFLLPVRVASPLSPETVDPLQTTRSGAIVDILALDPREPGRWALRTGAAEWLGAIEPQYLDPEPVPSLALASRLVTGELPGNRGSRA